MAARILLIDDEPDFGEMTKVRLEANAMHVDIALDGAAGLEKAMASTPDLILLDMMMPGMDGIEVLRKLRKNQRTRYIPVIMLTAKGESKSIFKAQDAGATEYLIKPCDPAALLRTVSKYMSKL